MSTHAHLHTHIYNRWSTYAPASVLCGCPQRGTRYFTGTSFVCILGNRLPWRQQKSGLLRNKFCINFPSLTVTFYSLRPPFLGGKENGSREKTGGFWGYVLSARPTFRFSGFIVHRYQQLKLYNLQKKISFPKEHLGCFFWHSDNQNTSSNSGLMTLCQALGSCQLCPPRGPWHWWAASEALGFSRTPAPSRRLPAGAYTSNRERTPARLNKHKIVGHFAVVAKAWRGYFNSFCPLYGSQSGWWGLEGLGLCKLSLLDSL